MLVKAMKPFGFLVVMMTLTSLACLGSSITPTPELPLPSPTELPPQPTAPEPTASPQSAEKFFTEEFNGDLSNWTYFNVLGSTKTNESGLSLEVVGGYLSFDITAKELYTYVIYTPFSYKDVAIELRAENVGTNNNAIGMVCRYSDEGWYEIDVQNNGLYKIFAATYDASGSVVYNSLADGGSNKIKVGKETNEYKMICKDRSISLYINGFETRVLNDNQYVLPEGQVGFSVASFSDPTVKVNIDWVKISQP
jgi:hypothetical protein